METSNSNAVTPLTILSDEEKPEMELAPTVKERLAKHYDSLIGINSKDGLDGEEVAKALNILNETAGDKEKRELVDLLLEAYSDKEVKGTGKTFEELILESLIFIFT